MRLIVKDSGKEVTKGMVLDTFRGEPVTVTDWREPQHPGSTGRIYIQTKDGSSREFFPSVCGLVWKE